MLLAFAPPASAPLADTGEASDVITPASEPALVYGTGAKPVAILIEFDNESTSS